MDDQQLLEQKIEKAYHQYIKQIATQSTLLAGFAFAGLTAITFDPATPQLLVNAFWLAATIAIGCELLALFVAGILDYLAEVMAIEQQFRTELWIAWIAYVVGLFAF